MNVLSGVIGVALQQHAALMTDLDWPGLVTVAER